MKENSYYKTPDGTVHKVTIYDDVNKMVCIADPINPSQNKWIHESEYSTWVECDIEGNLIADEIEPELTIEEKKPIKKKAVKKAAPKKAVAKKEPIKKAATKKKKNAAHKK